MKITITKEFTDIDEAIAFLVGPAPAPQIGISMEDVLRASALPETGVETPNPRPTAPEKKTRKPRADAGVPRGPYKDKAEPAAPQADKGPSTVSAAAVTDGAEGGTNSPAPAAEPAKVPTIDDVKAAMTVLSKKRGIEANMKVLAQFGVQKVSLLPKESYPAFIAAVLAAAA